MIAHVSFVTAPTLLLSSYPRNRFDAIDRRFGTIDERFVAVDARFDAVDRKFDTVDARFDALEQRMSRQFIWLAGMQFTALLAIMSALFAR
jgi:hypothetical protein